MNALLASMQLCMAHAQILALTARLERIPRQLGLDQFSRAMTVMRASIQQ